MKQSSSKIQLTLLGVAGLALAGCGQTHTNHSDGISPAAGDAVRGAMLLQTVDPWPDYVLDTDIVTDGELAAKRATDYRKGETKPIEGERSTGGSSASAQ